MTSIPPGGETKVKKHEGERDEPPGITVDLALDLKRRERLSEADKLLALLQLAITSDRGEIPEDARAGAHLVLDQVREALRH